MASKVIDLLDKFEDPRDQEKVVHPLSTTLFISICAIFCGAEGWEDIVLWGERYTGWLAKHVDMTHGVPSYSTIRRMFQIIAPACWGKLIQQTIDDRHPNKTPEDHIPIDGKTLRGSKCAAKDVRAMQIVSAWSVENEIILGKVKTDSKSNEVTAIPLLLDLLDLADATLTIDAIGCNEKIIGKILEKGAHYLIGFKKNQPTLFEEVESYWQSEGIQLDNLIADYFDNSHGRSVRRRYFSFDVTEKWLF